MSFENIQLPPFLIQDLYKDLLIDEKGTSVSSISLKKAMTGFLGGNEKNILVFVNEEKAAFLGEADLALLIKILSGCHLSLADIALVNLYHNKPLNNAKLNEQFRPSKNILLGVLPSDLELPMHFPPYQVQHYNNQDFLCGPSLKELAEDENLKKQLWQSLKKLFSL